MLSVALCIHDLSHFIGFLRHFLTCVGSETRCSTLALLQWIRSRITRWSGTPCLYSKCSSPMGRWAVWEYTRQCNITQVRKKTRISIYHANLTTAQMECFSKLFKSLPFMLTENLKHIHKSTIWIRLAPATSVHYYIYSFYHWHY